MPYSYGHDGIVLRIKDVNLSFTSDAGKELPILKNVNAEVKNITRPGLSQGQVVALLGPSGIGKTQLFRMMAGLATPGATRSGEIYLGANDTPVQAGLVGVVAQHYPLFAHRTVRGNLHVAAANSGKSKSEIVELEAQLLRAFDMEKHADKYPAQLSGGQRQRVAIAQQMMCSKYFMLLDEPFSGLDPLMITRALELISAITSADEYNTTIIVTHDINSALCVADTLWVLGRDRDAQGNPIPGAYIKHTYCLAEMGLAWRPDIRKLPEFSRLVNEVRDLFPTL